MRKRRSIGYWIALILIFCIRDASAFELKGFGDVNFEKVAGSDKKERTHGSFFLGDLDLYISEQIDDRLDVLGEVLIELGDEEVDVERFHIGYIFSDAVKIRAGRFHTPLGFWNTSFHHGAQLQPTIDRPEILKFESDGGVLPAHTIGASATGRFKLGASIFLYDLMIGNGDRIEKKEEGRGVLSPNVKTDDNSNKSIAFSLAVKPGLMPGLKVGISGDILRIQSEEDVLIDGVPVDVKQFIVTPALLYSMNNLDIWGEYFYIKNEDKKGIVEDKTSNGYYLLFTYNLNDQWIPYILHESRNIEGGDRYFRALAATDIHETIGGVRYNSSYRSCIKVEGRMVNENHDHFNEYAIQWAISF